MRVASAVELVAWQQLDADERAAVLGLRISPEQVEFAGAVERSVAACESADPALAVGLAIRTDAGIVGWLSLRRSSTTPEWARGEALMGGLRVDESQQGRGIGQAALAELPRWIARHWPGTPRLVLRVDDGNAAGIRAYERAGWTEVGERRVGRVGVERTMALEL